MERQRKVLVVDDDEFTLQSMARTLGDERYRVVTAASGSGAIDLMKQESFDLVLADLKMPGMDGLEVLRQAKEIAPHVVVLMLTGYASLESAIEALREGAYDYLVKPCPDDELKLKIEKGLERVRLVEERQRAEEALRESEERYRVIFEQAADSIVLIDAETGALVEFNDRAHENIGYTREEFEKLRIPDFEVIESAEEVAKHVEKIIKEGADTFETKHRTRGGEIRDIQVNSRAISIRGRDFVQSIWHDITERKRAEETLRRAEAETRRHLKEQIALREAGTIITSTLDLAGVLAHIAEQMGRAIDATSAYISQHDPETKVFTVVAEYIGPEACAQEQVSDLGVSYHYTEDDIEFLKAMETGRHDISQLDDVDLPESERARMQEYGAQTIIYIPLRVKERLVGFAELWESRQRREFTPEEIALCQGISQQAAIAIENARLYVSQQQLAQERGTLLDITQATTSTLDMTEVLKLVTQRAAQACGANRCTILLLDKEGKTLTPAMSQFTSDRVDKKMWQLFEDMRYPRPLAEVPEAQQVLREGRPLFIPDALASSQPRPWIEPFDIKSLLVVPMISKGHPMGIMGLDHVEEGKGFSAEQVNLAMAIGAQAAIAIDNAQLYEETKRRATELGILYEVATAAAASIRLDETLNRAMATLQETLRPDDIAILLVEPETNELFIRAHTGFPGGPKLMRRPIGVGIPGWVVRTGQPALLADVREDERYQACDPDTRSELCVPLRVGERTIGALNLESRRLAAFSEDDLRLLSILAGNLVAIIENARLFEETEERRLYLEGLLGAAPDAIVTLDARHRIVEWNPGAERLFGYSREEVIGRDLDRLVTSPEVLEEATGFRQVVMGGKELPPVETVRYRKDGSPVDVLLAASPILVGDELIGIVTVYTDITTQKRAKEMLRRRAEELAALQATVLDITTPHDLPTLLQTIVERSTLLLNTPGGGLYLCHPDRGEVRCVVSYNTPRNYTGTVLKYGEGAAGIVAQTGESLIIDDYRTWSGRAAAYEEEQPFTAVLSAPMIWQGQVTGVIDVLHDVESRRFTEADLELLTLFANHAAIAVENSRLYEQAQEEITERKRAEEELQDSLEKLRKALGGTIQAIALTVERRDPYTAGHQRQVADLARAIATEMGLSKEQVDGIRMAGVIHDIGKTSVPSEILSKPGQLGDIEFSLIKTHPQVGYDILKTIDFPWPVAEIVLQHHERVDGSGYPQGLPGGEIMLEARILAVADVVAAMASHRPYRPPHGLDKALEEISQNKGVLYDPEVVDTCLKLFTEKGFKFE